MSSYRLYFMNRSSGHIERYEEFDAADDREAVGLAARRSDGHPLELWCGHRKVRQFGPGAFAHHRQAAE